MLKSDCLSKQRRAEEGRTCSTENILQEKLKLKENDKSDFQMINKKLGVS